ncbi:MAG: TetR/AcrR family transcriptional regulator [Acidimicrobiales bacterium]|nr:TetR/AcrR family transcriptional regulator [Acidimicrobiales bacterium]
MSPKPTRSRTATADLVPAVLDAASRLLQQEGPDALSIRRIATEAGVAPMSLYNHFGGKHGIVEALFQRGFEALTTSLRAIEATSAEQRFRTGMRCYRRFALDHPAVYAVMFQKLVPDFEPGDEAKAAAAQTFLELVGCMSQGMAEGVFAAGDPVATGQLVWGACHGIVALELVEIGFVEDRDANYESLLEVLLAGLRNTKAS